MKSNKKQKVIKSQKRSNTEYSLSLEHTEFSNNESTETTSDNEESKSETSENLSQNSKSIPNRYRPLLKAIDDDLLPTLLDPHHKKLKFTDSLDCKYVENTLW
ncbi:17468_t:CDS:2, partial [Cetraspora pellucida]